MVLITILDKVELNKKDRAYTRNINYDLNTIKEDLKELEYIYNNLEDYKEQRLLDFFILDQEYYNTCIDFYKKIDFVINNGDYFLINEDFLTYSIKCRNLLTKIIRKLKKMLT